MVEGMHLMHVYPREFVCVRIEPLGQHTRLAVRERDDDVGTHSNVCQNGLGPGCGRGHSDDRILPVTIPVDAGTCGPSRARIPLHTVAP